MAARKNPQTTTKEKSFIQARQLLNRLYSFANGEVEMTAAQVQAAKIVIGKVIPDLRSIEHTGNQENPLKMLHEIRRTIINGNSGDKDTGKV